MDSFGVLPSSSKLFAVRRPGVIAEPAEALEALAEFFRDGWRQPGVDVFEAALPGVALGGGVQREQPLPALARRAGAGIEQQVRLCGEAQQRRADDAIALRRVSLRGIPL